MKIFLDIDDTLANTSGYVKEKYNHKVYHPNSSLIKRNFYLIKDYFVLRHVRDNPVFWTELPLLDHSKDLVDYCKNEVGKENLFILTALPFLFYKKETKEFLDAKHAKTQWVKKHFNFIEEQNIHVVYAREKHQFLTGKQDVLIDDSQKNIYNWKNSGGHAILYHHGLSLEDIKIKIKKLT